MSSGVLLAEVFASSLASRNTQQSRKEEVATILQFDWPGRPQARIRLVDEASVTIYPLSPPFSAQLPDFQLLTNTRPL